MTSRRTLAAIPLLLLGSACADLEIDNPNAPELERVLSDPASIGAMVDAAVNAWWLAATNYEPYIMLDATADALTGNCCWVRFNNEEPRLPFNNRASGSDALIALRPWTSNHDVVNDATDALRSLDHTSVSDPVAAERLRAAGLFALAGAHSNLALVFDSAFIHTNPVGVIGVRPLEGYSAVRDAALDAWDELIALTDGKAWSLEPATLPLSDGPPTASRLNRIARTMAARTLVLSARNATENAETPWQRVLAYADGGITGAGVADMDFGVVYDGVDWFDYLKLYGDDASRFRVDQRLIARMAPNIPVKFAGLDAQPLPVSQDARLAIATLPCVPNDPVPCTAGITADFVYVGNVILDASRGVFMQSPFWHRRWVTSSWHTPDADRIGLPLIHVLAAENDLMIAEALVRTGGDLSRAADLVNKTHVGRGGRTPVAATPSALLAAIEYERDVELYATGGIALFDRRRVDGLQPGTLRHLPVPAEELELMRKPVYTYGGVGLPDM